MGYLLQRSLGEILCTPWRCLSKCVKFEEWKCAIGVSWKQYLKAVVENGYKGSWAKEVAEQLFESEDG